MTHACVPTRKGRSLMAIDFTKLEKAGASPQLVEMTKVVAGIHGGGSKRAAVALYLDRSDSTQSNPLPGRYSTTNLWTDGTMQHLVDTTGAILLGGFDDNGNGPIRFFDSMVQQPLWPQDGLLTAGNASQIVAKNSSMGFGGTAFMPVFLDLVRQALLLEANTKRWRFRAALKEQEIDRINSMTNQQLRAFITPEIRNGAELLQAKLKLPYPVYGLVGTDGESFEALDELKKTLRWMSQIGIYVMLVGVGTHNFRILNQLDKAGEEQAGPNNPLWDNADFVDFKSLTEGIHRQPDPLVAFGRLLGAFHRKAYPACKRLELVA